MPARLVRSFALFSTLFLLIGCKDKPGASSSTAADAEIQSVADSIAFRDKSGATLTVKFSEHRAPKTYLSDVTTTAYSVPVRIRFQGGEADSEFRKMTELAPDDEVYWDFDKKKKVYEVGWPIAFLESLKLADRVFLEIKLSDDERKALVFDVPDSERDILSSELEANSMRVDNEMRALGLGKYSPEPEASKPDPLTVDVEEEGMFALFDEYVLSMSRITQDEMLPAPTAADNQAMEASYDLIRPVTGAINHYKQAYPDAIAEVERLVENAGFESLEQWVAIGNRVQMGMTVLTFDQQNNGHIDKVRATSRTDLESLDAETRKYYEVIQAFSDRELEWFAENHARFKIAAGN